MKPPYCQCGHVRNVHEHHRSGTDCAFCSCPRYRRRWWYRRRPLEAPADLEAPTGVWAMFADDTRIELEPTFIRFDGPIAVWEVKLGEEHGPMISMGAGKIPPNVGIEWLIPGMPRWRHP